MLQVHTASPTPPEDWFSSSSIVSSPAQVSRGNNPIISGSGLLSEGLVPGGRISAFPFCPFRPLTKFTSLLRPYWGPWFLASCHLRDFVASRSHPRSWGLAVSPSSQAAVVSRDLLRLRKTFSYRFSCHFTSPRAVFEDVEQVGPAQTVQDKLPVSGYLT